MDNTDHSAQATIETVPPAHGSIELRNRVRLSYIEQREPAGTPVVLLHGLTDSWRSFETVLPHLPESIHVFAPTQRGHGDSDRPDGGYDPRTLASDVAAFMDALGLESAVIVGHSMGSTVAQRFALDHPTRTQGLVLVGAILSWHGNQAIMELEDVVSTLTDPIDPGFVREFQQSTLAGHVAPEFLDTVVSESLNVPARVWKAMIMGFVEDEFSSELNDIQAPTLILWGDRDEMLSRHDQDGLIAAIPDSRLIVYAGAGHANHWEQPERFANDLLDFAGSLGR